MMKSFASMLFVLTAALLLSSPAHAGYSDGMNQYAGYHVMRGGVDPMGLQAGPTQGLGEALTQERDNNKKLNEIVGSTLDSMSSDIEKVTRKETGTDTFFNALKGARGNVTFVSGGVQGGNAADYSPLWNKMYFNSTVVKSGKFTSAGRITAMHEMVHALDDQKNWYLKFRGRSHEKAEALAYGSEFVYEAAQNLSRIERRIRDGERCYGDNDDGIYEHWNKFWGNVNNRMGTYNVVWGSNSRKLNTSDLSDLRSKTGFGLSCSKLATEFNFLLDNSDVPYLNCGCILRCPDNLPAYFK